MAADEGDVEACKHGQRLFRLRISPDGRSVELLPFVAHGTRKAASSRCLATFDSSHSGKGVAAEAPEQPHLGRQSTADIDAYEATYFDYDPVVDSADRFDPIGKSAGSGRGRKRGGAVGSCSRTRAGEFEHGYKPPPPLPERPSRWSLLVSALLRREGWWVDSLFCTDAVSKRGGSGRGRGRGVTIREVQRWERRHGACGEAERRWQARKEELAALRHARVLRKRSKKVEPEQPRRRPAAVRRQPSGCLSDAGTVPDPWVALRGPVTLELAPGLDRNQIMAAQLGVDEETYRLLQQLQVRDIGPEDYELLGRLDENIKPATLDGRRLKLFPTEMYSAPEEDAAAQDKDAGGQFTCGVCLVDFEEGEELRTLLPCGHKFHKDCIDYWLLERSTCCPVDNLTVADLPTSAASSPTHNGREVAAAPPPAGPTGTAVAEAEAALAAVLGAEHGMQLQVEMLISMGFDAGKALEALMSTGGDMEAAADLLLMADDDESGDEY
eukprot:gnl/TRDRNA2_/TRDRNA2_165984_c0_seq1.p1 gnl/TRDRNA2_/TRDRNA2_165984_c0~~gnl/TRDRNA2_/TRDRNA2_165984_c0_seq1.p1  ORF type:complete len:497 (+),score=90.44 gnl/TRDRNA2_/TRDRNA2_165984_c0_seq1:66-1556(+)